MAELFYFTGFLLLAFAAPNVSKGRELLLCVVGCSILMLYGYINLRLTP